jgi:TolB-like protein/Tfp pilus assembly protein PilF
VNETAPGFFARLKQRKLVQWAIAYGAFAFALIQVLDVVAGSYHWPDHGMHIVFGLLALGFLVALILAWYHGERGAQRISGPELLLIALVLAVGGGLLWHFGKTGSPVEATNAPANVASRQEPAPASSPASAPFNPPAGTLAVLPFTNLNGDPKQQYFSDGITEELTNALGQNAALTVIAWDTASKFRDSHKSPNAVGVALNVANLVHGSIEREGGMIRVLAELVDTRTGKQLWSDHYDDSAANVFQVQDKISAAIAAALNVKFAALGPASIVNPKAHDLVLKAHALMETARTAAPIEQARALLEQAIALDPGYADAHAKLAGAWLDLTQYSTLTLKDALPKARAEANQALALDPRNVTALLVLANDDGAEHKIAQAKTKFERALALDPSNVSAHVDYGNALPTRQALAQYLEAVQLDPRNATAQNNLGGAELDLDEYAQALPPTVASMKLAPQSADSAMSLALVYSLLHRPEDAVKAFDLAQPDTPLAKALVAAGRLTYQSVLDPKLHAQALAAVHALRKRSDLDPNSMVDVMQLDLALGQNDTVLELLPNICAAMPVGCTNLSVNPVWLPLRGQPAFQALVKKYDTASQTPASASSPSSP